MKLWVKALQIYRTKHKTVKYLKIGCVEEVKMAKNNMFHVEQFEFGCVFHVKQKSR